MNDRERLTAYSRRLPDSLQKEVLDFVRFLESRYADQRETPTPSVTEGDVEPDCGILKAPHGVALEEMDAAIRARGGQR